MASLELKERTLIRCLFSLFEVQMLVMQPRHPKRFSKASLEERTRNLQSWDKSNLHLRRVAFQALRSLLLWAYVDNSTVGQEIGVESGTKITGRRQRIKEALETAARNSAA